MVEREFIVRGYIVPRRMGKVFRQVEEIGDEERVKFLSRFEEIVKYALETYERRTGGKLTNAHDINIFLNYLVTLIRTALYRDPIPGVVPAMAGGSPYYLLKLQREGPSKPEPEEYLKFLRDGIGAEEVQRGKSIISEGLLDLLRFPADTRPGANTSSLLIHSLVVSGLASCHYLGQRMKQPPDWGDANLALLRLMCMFHDVGKFLDWSRHEEISEGELKKLFEEHVEKEAKELVTRAASLLKRESSISSGDHVLRWLREVYERADVEASALDRLATNFLKVLSERSRELIFRKAREFLRQERVSEKEFKEKCYVSYSFWQLFSKEEILQLTQDFCEQASRLTDKNPLLKEEPAETKQSQLQLEVARLDVRNIQAAIKVNDLRTMAGGSLLVDYVVFVGLPLTLTLQYGLPAEAILYYGGGNITVMLPRGLTSKIAQELSGLHGLSLAIAKYEWTPSFQAINQGIEGSMLDEKLRPREAPHSDVLDLNAFRLCSICGRRAASITLEDKQICSVCKKRREYGEQFHFWHKIQSLELLELSESLLKYVLEYIAGGTREEVKEGRFKEYKNLAVLRLDANLAGAFMGSAVSITDAFERSIRIDLSIKKAYTSFLDMVRRLDRESYNRLVLGTIYLGGDDGFILAPSGLAVHLALHLLNEFYMEMGGMLSLSCGLASAKPKHPLIPLYDAAGYLLDEVAKENAREEAYRLYAEASREEPSQQFRGSLAFFPADGSFLTPEALHAALSRLARDGTSLQHRDSEGYVLASPQRPNSVLRLLALVSPSASEGPSADGTEIDELVGRDLEGWVLKEQRKKQAKEVIRTVKDHFTLEFGGDRSSRLSVIYALRQRERLRGETLRIIDGVLRNVRFDSQRGILLPLADIINFAKVMLGE
jgi:hypothetical protein